MYVKKHNRDLKTILNNTDDLNLIDLVKKILTFDPIKRLSISEVLKHPYFKEFHDPSKEPTNFRRMTPDQNFNSMLEIREFMYTLIQDIHT
jgi:serine/threonine protein kinase